jgi:hypothetical protein
VAVLPLKRATTLAYVIKLLLNRLMWPDTACRGVPFVLQVVARELGKGVATAVNEIATGGTTTGAVVVAHVPLLLVLKFSLLLLLVISSVLVL